MLYKMATSVPFVIFMEVLKKKKKIGIGLEPAFLESDTRRFYKSVSYKEQINSVNTFLQL